jgi:hypothetical protein
MANATKILDLNKVNRETDRNKTIKIIILLRMKRLQAEADISKLFNVQRRETAFIVSIHFISL